jgi:ribosomal protein S18 acetylase RimI-like enzyme
MQQGPETASRVVIRRCRASDLDALEWNGEFTHDRHIIEWAFARTRVRTMLMLVAEASRAHVGQAWIDLARAPGVGLVWALRVKPAWQRRGIGARLLRACERVIAARGRGAAALEVEPQNAEARSLYERLGYIHIRCELAWDEAGRVLGRGFDVLHKCLRGAR